MLGAIAGDIIGSRFEGCAGPPREFRLFHPACRFTDDSVCTLAVADALLGERDFAASLRAFVRRHPARGYGGMFLEWALADDAPAYGSWGNGAPMRVAAVGWLARDEAEALELAAAQAAVSHDHPDAIAASQAVALAILLARSGIPRTILRRRLIDDFGYDLAPEHALARGGFDISAAGTVPPAITAALVAGRSSHRGLPRRRRRHSRVHSRSGSGGGPQPSTSHRRLCPILSNRRSTHGFGTVRGGGARLAAVGR